MARKFKMHCNRCGGEVDQYRMELMMGPKGFRSYPVHIEKCPKVRNANHIKGTKGAMMKAGVA